MSSAFESLPVELRMEIYSYLLLDLNVTYTAGDAVIRAQYETSLFRVCTLISAKSLDFFYSQNAFIVFDTDITMGLSYAIPMHPVSSALAFKHYSLWMAYRDSPQQEDVTSPLLENYPVRAAMSDLKIEKWPPYTAIVAARHLPIIVYHVNRQISFENSWNRTYDGGEIALRFRFTDVYIRNKHRLVAALVYGLQDLRAPSLNTAPVDIEMLVSITGDLDEKERQGVRDAITPASYHLTDLLTVLPRLLAQGDKFVKQKDFTSARGQYKTAYQLAGRLLIPEWHEEVLEKDLTQIIREHGINVRLGISTVETGQGFHFSAISSAQAAWQFTLGPDVVCTSDQKAKIKLQLGTALACAGQYKRAVLELCDAVRLTPTDAAALDKLREVKELYDMQTGV